MPNPNIWKRKATSTLTPTDNTKRREVLVKSLNIEAEILEIHWASGIDAARNKTKITAPHWKLGDKLEEEDKPESMHFMTGSQKPGVYLIDGKGKHELKVKIKIIKSGLMGDATLQGKLGSLSMSGEFKVSVGEHMVDLKIEKPPKDCQHIEGDATWRLDAGSAGSKDLKDKTRLEVFFVLDKPMSFYTQGVWVEALRLAFKNAKVTGMTDASKAAAAITKYCHTGHGMTYDTVSGGSQFKALTTGGSSFEFLKYIQKDGRDGNKVNCYDQAAAVQSITGAIGVKTEWIFLSPYGFINSTNLVGVGTCNNPFFSSNGTKPVVPVSDKDRTAFGNHAFISTQNKIDDACAGPHLNTETLRQYMKAAIDAAATIPLVAPGYKIDDYYSALEKLPNPQAGLTGVK